MTNLYKKLFIPVLCVLIAYGCGIWVGHNPPMREIQIYSDILTNRTKNWQKTKGHYLIELELAKIRADIYKRQIKNLMAVNDGLKIIIAKDPATRNLVRKE